MKYEVGDKVRIKSLDWYNKNKTIHGDIWFDNAVFVGGQSLYCGCELTIRLVTDDSYHVIENDYYWTDDMIEGLVEKETVLNEWTGLKVELELSKSVIGVSNVESLHGERFMSGFVKAIIPPEGYIFKDENGNVINATKIVLEKKKKEYPKTFEKCVSVLMCKGGNRMPLELMNTFRKLIDARNAYWTIYGEENGLGKPWEPDWREERYIIYRNQDDIIGGYRKAGDVEHHIFEFPTKEMRDAFKENFYPDIEICKEFL